MMVALHNYCRFLNSWQHIDMLWLCRKTDWLKLLHLPDVSWLQLTGATACLVVVIWIIVRFVSRVNEDVDPAEADRQMLDSLDDLRREGDLTEDEFRLIKSQIMGRLATSWKVTGKSSGRIDPASAQGARTKVKSDEPLVESSLNQHETNEQMPSASNLIQSENIPSPTNLPEPTQDTNHQAEGQVALESEDSEGIEKTGPSTKEE